MSPGETSAPTPARVFVALGSNLGDRFATLEAALRSLGELALDGPPRRSALYESAPLGPADQPDYLNAACTFTTDLGPAALLAALHRIEAAAGRVRPARRWGARTLDLDLLLHGETVVDTPALRVPHPGIAERAFVLLPLRDLEPALEVPGLGPLAPLLDAVDISGIRRLPSVPEAPPNE